MPTKQQKYNNHNNEVVSTDETCPAFSKHTGMIKKPGIFGKSRAFSENARLFLQTTKT
jgi:hypothetical protein